MQECQKPESVVQDISLILCSIFVLLFPLFKIHPYFKDQTFQSKDQFKNVSRVFSSTYYHTNTSCLKFSILHRMHHLVKQHDLCYFIIAHIQSLFVYQPSYYQIRIKVTLCHIVLDSIMTLNCDTVLSLIWEAYRKVVKNLFLHSIIFKSFH